MDRADPELCPLCSTAFLSCKRGQLQYVSKAHQLSPNTCPVCAIIDFGTSTLARRAAEILIIKQVRFQIISLLREKILVLFGKTEDRLDRFLMLFVEYEQDHSETLYLELPFSETKM